MHVVTIFDGLPARFERPPGRGFPSLASTTLASIMHHARQTGHGHAALDELFRFFKHVAVSSFSEHELVTGAGDNDHVRNAIG